MRSTKAKPPTASLNALLTVLNVALLVTLTVLASTGVFKGHRGIDGVNGTDGEAGPPGATGPPGASGSSSPEAFSVSLLAPYVFSTLFYEPLNNFTATVYTDAFPDISPRMLFTDLTASTLNLATGIFTVGANGTYAINFSQFIPANPCAILF